MFLIVLFFLYQITQIIGLPVIICYVLFRKYKKKSLGSLKNRLGFIPKTHDGKTTIWIHAVSVGEVLSVEHFIKQYKIKHSDTQLYLTVGTTSGMHMAKNSGADFVSYLPFDFLLPMYLAFSKIRPSKIFIVEAEIWPNFLMLAYVKKIPVYLINGRINQTAVKNYLPIRCFFKNIFKLIHHFYVQNKNDHYLFTTIYAIPDEKISILGDIKIFNVVEKKESYALQPTNSFDEKNQRQCTLLVGSIHPGELDVYLHLFSLIKKQIAHAKLILVPRHFHWQQELENSIQKAGWPYFLWTNHTPPPTSQPFNKLFDHHDIIVVLKLGFLFSLYQYADIFFLGGTFVPVGGHNLLEPAVWAKPCIIGPHHHKCKHIAQELEKAGGLIKVSTPLELYKKTLMLCENHNTATSMGLKNKAWITIQAKHIKNNLEQIINNSNESAA